MVTLVKGASHLLNAINQQNDSPYMQSKCVLHTKINNNNNYNYYNYYYYNYHYQYIYYGYTLMPYIAFIAFCSSLPPARVWFTNVY